jgi:hypothetical protein
LRAALLLIAVAASSARAQEANVIPAQFIAKMYTEALGRAPDQPGWSRSVAFFAAQGCGAATLRQLGEEFYTSAEFASDYADNTAKVLALYRGALSRDADQAGLDRDVALLDAGVPWPQVVAALFDSAEFAGNVPSMCSAAAPDYHFGDQVPPTPAPGRDGFAGTGAELRIRPRPRRRRHSGLGSITRAARQTSSDPVRGVRLEPIHDQARNFGRTLKMRKMPDVRQDNAFVRPCKELRLFR